MRDDSPSYSAGFIKPFKLEWLKVPWIEELPWCDKKKNLEINRDKRFTTPLPSVIMIYCTS